MNIIVGLSRATILSRTEQKLSYVTKPAITYGISLENFSTNCILRSDIRRKYRELTSHYTKITDISQSVRFKPTSARMWLKNTAYMDVLT